MIPPARDALELIPARPQTLWGWPAVVNFVAGGAGAGLYLAAALTARFGASPLLTLASCLSPALVLLGFVAVGAEAGRPLRGPRVLARAGTSWMSRELWLGGAFVLLAGAELVAPDAALRLGAAVAAVAFAAAQGFILRRARAIAAWDVPVMPLVFVASALVSGVGLALVVETVAGRAPGAAWTGAAMVLVALSLLVWLGYVTWSREPAFASATLMLREGSAAIAIVGGGYVAPLLLLALGLALPGLAAPAGALAGMALTLGQACAKSVLIVSAGRLRPVTLTNLSLQRRSS
jgi:DMSO reductase anchor subunit